SGGCEIKLITRKDQRGLSSAILAGIRASIGESVVVMDSDFSHPPETIAKMIEELKRSDCDIVVASRYVEGGSITGWPFKRKLISKGATKIAQRSLGIKIKDPMSGFFAFRRHIIRNIKFDAIGYKILLEILVKAKEARVKEIPYNFTDRKSGESKLDRSVISDYIKSVWKLYRYGKSIIERRTSVHFLSKAGRFYTVGASGLLVNYIVSFLFGAVLSNLWYIYATMIGILFSMTSNFILNKIWTFEDRDTSLKRTLLQYGSFLAFSGVGAMFQLGMVYVLVGTEHMSYALALFVSVAIASIGNFILNKRWTFKEKIWS
ncbi:MAG: glycosyltransferase family 2 protein, partial [Thaumarchaeota archaeon]|nr:glycosyltransferase family 2 protein [Nitrososphaerota archaeon]